MIQKNDTPLPDPVSTAQPTSIIFACDESGAKGYSDKDEVFSGEVGVFAGILMPKADKASKLPIFQALIKKYKPESGKLHIADLDSVQQGQLREDVYSAIQNSGLPVFWYAIHAAGFHHHYSTIGNLDNYIQRNANSRIRVSSNKPAPESLHVALFAGLYGHLVAFCEERLGAVVNIEIRSDNVDKPIIRQFLNSANEMLDLSPVAKTHKGFDIVTKQVVEGTITTSIKEPESMAIDTTVQQLHIETTDDSDGLVLAADVIANSLAHLFHKRSAEELYTDLNRPEAIAAHPLAKSLDSFRNWGGRDLIGDTLYMHPKNPNRFPAEEGDE